MPYDADQGEPQEWFQPADEAEPTNHAPLDLRWPTGEPVPPPPPAQQMSNDTASRAPVATMPAAARPSSFVISAAPLAIPVPLPRPAQPEAEDHGSGGSGWGVRHVEHASNPSPDFLFAPPAAETLWPAARAHQQRTPARRIALLGVALVTLVALGALAWSDFSHPTYSITQPTQVGALTQLSDPQLDTTMQTLQRAVLTGGASNVVDGVYGTAGRPQLVLIVVQSSTVSSNAPPLDLQSFFAGLARGAVASGWTLERAHASTTTVDGTNFECSPISAPALQSTKLSTCAWSDSDVAGVVMDISGQPVADTLNQAVQARTATEH